MSEEFCPQIYLATPEQIDWTAFEPQFKAVLDALEIACIRITAFSNDEALIRKSADMLRNIAHERDIPIVIDTHFRFADEHGLDGVHLLDGTKQIAAARKLLGKDAIVGAYCGISRHTGMTAGEMGADYVAFGPVNNNSSLGSGEIAEPELFQWWSEMIEVPVVAEGFYTDEALNSVIAFTDFLMLGPEIWSHESPAKAAEHITKLLASA